MVQKHIIAASSGYALKDGIPTLGPLIGYGLTLTGKETPKLCYIGTAGGDESNWTTTFYTACHDQNVVATHLQLFPKPNVKDVRDYLLKQDMIWVGGGSVANLLAVWRTHGLDEIMREAWEKGIVLAGVSAGSICWHLGGVTDSFGVNLQAVTNGLGFLPYAKGVHYDSEAIRRPMFQKLIADGIFKEGYATDDGVALHYIDTSFHKAIADTPDKYAYHVIRKAGKVVETRLNTELLI